MDAQLMGLTLSTIGNQVWAKLIQERANNLFSKTVPQLYVLYSGSPGSQQLEQYNKATLSFTDDCSELASRQQECLHLAREQTPEEQAICNILPLNAARSCQVAQ